MLNPLVSRLIENEVSAMNRTGCKDLKYSLQTIFSKNKANLCKIKSDNDLLSALDSNLSENEFNAQDTNFQIKLI